MIEVFKLSLPPIDTNCYVLADSKTKECIVIDPASNGKYVNDWCQSHGYKVKSILLTHGHFDHIGGVDELVKLSGATLFIHKEDAEMLNDTCKNAFGYFFAGEDIVSTSSYTTIEDGQTFDLGGETITTIHTPGHTKGSVVYLTDKYAFTGDTIMQGGMGRTDLYGGDDFELGQSVRKLIPLIRTKIIYPGHGPEFDWRSTYEL
ncbi:MAG: MBL fold metallo-hydrolase [Clostridiales bacterium]|nr:MBL fold metallo-hydrolase [Clostridiales bacterium]